MPGELMATERTFAMLKPDAVQRGVIGEIITRFECRGLKIIAMKMMRIDPALAERHYAEHIGKGFYPGLVQFITAGPVVPMVLEGKNAISMVRTMMGATDPQKSAPGTIRGDFAIDLGRNIIHGSDGPESAKREIGLFFSDAEMQTYTRAEDSWVNE